MSTQIDHPDYYSPDTVEVIDVIQAWHLDFALGSALKYIARAGRKPRASKEDDLRKAIWYLNFVIESRDMPNINRDELLGAPSLFSPERVMLEWELNRNRCAAIVGIWNAMCSIGGTGTLDHLDPAIHLRTAIHALEAELGTESSETNQNQ